MARRVDEDNKDAGVGCADPFGRGRLGGAVMSAINRAVSARDGEVPWGHPSPPGEHRPPSHRSRDRGTLAGRSGTKIRAGQRSALSPSWLPACLLSRPPPDWVVRQLEGCTTTPFLLFGAGFVGGTKALALR